MRNEYATQIGHNPLIRYMKCGVEYVGSLFVYLSLCFVVFSPNFLKLSQLPKYTKTGTTWCLDGLYFWVRPHLVWNIEFNTFSDFLWLHLDPIFQKSSQSSKYTKTSIAGLSNGLYTWVKHYLISNVELNDLDHRLCIFLNLP